MHDSIQLPEIAPFRAISPVPRRNQRHCLIAVLQVAAPILAGRITFPLLLLTGALLLVQPCAGESGTWTETGSMGLARNRHRATLLAQARCWCGGVRWLDQR